MTHLQHHGFCERAGCRVALSLPSPTFLARKALPTHSSGPEGTTSHPGDSPFAPWALPPAWASSPWITCPPTSFLGPSSWPPSRCVFLALPGSVSGRGRSRAVRTECQARAPGPGRGKPILMGFPMISMCQGSVLAGGGGRR